MDKFVVEAGGLRFQRGDFNFFQDAVRDAFEGLALGIANDKVVILSGMVISGAISITDGYCIIGGEICKHVNTTYPDFIDLGADGIYWDIEETIDTAGNENLVISSVATEPRKIRRAVIKPYTGSLPVGKIAFNDEISISKSILDLVSSNSDVSTLWTALANSYGTWTNCSLSSNWSVSSGGVAKYRITNDGYVEIVLNVQMDSSGTALIFTLPNAAWPSTKYYVKMISPAGDCDVLINNTNGQVTVPAGGVVLYTTYKLYCKIPLSV